MKIVIVGCGWLGSKLAENLTAAGHSVTGTRRSAVEDSLSFPIIPFDPAAPVSETAREVFGNADRVVIAFPPGRQNPEAYAQHCLKTAELCGPETLILMVSSTGVYADSVLLADEKAALGEGSGIAAAENQLAGSFGKRLTIIRMAGLFGAGRIIVNHMVNSGKTYNGNEPVNLIHQSDAAGICQFVIENGIAGEIINGCTHDHPAKKDFYARLAQKAGLPSPLFSDGPAGKTVSADKSQQLGYSYIFQTAEQLLGVV